MVAVTRVRFGSDDPVVQQGLEVADQLRRRPRIDRGTEYSFNIATTIEERAEGEGLPLFDDELGWVS